ncbi:MAG: DASS family sodium-coupled anion symporter [Negativicutes bacterium]|nr:DASS family sodium-coupled anion symporter [Negativicutes bacterium]
MTNNKIIKLLGLALVLCIVFFIPPPKGLSVEAWRLAGIFIVTMVGIMLQALPDASLLLISITFSVTFVVPLRDVIIGFADSTIWLIITAFMLVIGFKKSGLAKRVGLLLVMSFGKTSLRVAYCLALFDAILATSVPSIPGRTGGLVYPLADGVIQAVDPDPGKNPRRIAGYLIVLLYMVAMTTGSLFLTGIAVNPFGASMANDILGTHIDWNVWAVGAAPGWLVLFAIPWVLAKIWPPELKSLDGLKQFFGEELKKMGPVTRKEWIAVTIFLIVLVLWMTGGSTKLDATVVGFIGLSLMILFNIVEWKDLVEAKEPWTMLIWYGGILGISAALIKLKFYVWLAEMMKLWLPTAGLSIFAILVIVALLINLLHYFFASTIGYVAALAPLFFSFLATTDVPKYPAAFIVLFLMATSATLTHYGNGVGPVLFAKEYVPKKAWWGIGLVVATLHTVVYLTLGLAYWKWIGYWY